MMERTNGMDFVQKENSILLYWQKDFILSQTLECGQCFRYEQLGKEYYRIIAYGKILDIKYENRTFLFYNTSIEDFKKIWIPYFDLSRDYKDIKSQLEDKDTVIKTAITHGTGIRILNQEFFECLISFIISQNNNIPRIQRIIRMISEEYGDFLGEIDGKRYFSFPSPKQLKDVSAEDFMKCNAGFRGKYIVDAVQKVLKKEIDSSIFSDLSTAEVRQMLMIIKGVGPKVADCVLLFSCGRKEVFPIDVWVKRMMSYFYFEGNEITMDAIHRLADKKYGQWAGFAQQYLFYYARQMNIGK